MNNVYIPTNGQLGSNVGGGLWFSIPEELQAAAMHIMETIADDVEQNIRVRERASDILGTDSGYSHNLYIGVGSRRYAIYRRDGGYRIGDSGETSSAPYKNDQELILNYLQELNITA